MWIHLYRYLARVADHTVTLGGTSRVGFLCFLLLPPLISGFESARARVKSGVTWMDAMKQTQPASLFKKPVVIIWLCLVIWSLGAVAYQDHVSLVASGVGKNDLIRAKDAQISKKNAEIARLQQEQAKEPSLLSKPRPVSPQSTEWIWSKAKEDSFVAGAKSAPANFKVVAAMDDPESFRFGLELTALLKSAGWTPASDIIRTPWAGRFQGVTIHVANQNFQPAADLQSDFRVNGLYAEGKLDPSVQLNTVEIDVGYKPDYWRP